MLGFEQRPDTSEQNEKRKDSFRKSLRVIQFYWCRGPDSNRHGPLRPTDFKSVAYTNFATPASFEISRIAAVSSAELKMEAAPGIEPGIKALQASALPLGYAASTVPESTQVNTASESGK